MSRALWSGPALGGKATKKFLAIEQHDLHYHNQGIQSDVSACPSRMAVRGKEATEDMLVAFSFPKRKALVSMPTCKASCNVVMSRKSKGI